jgi:hypothetical protein
VVLGGGSSGQQLDDGDYNVYDCSYDSTGQDTVDGSGSGSCSSL